MNHLSGDLPASDLRDNFTQRRFILAMGTKGLPERYPFFVGTESILGLLDSLKTRQKCCKNT